LIVFTASCTTCRRPTPRPVITDIVLTESSIIIEVEESSHLDFLGDLWLDPKNIPSGLAFEIQQIKEKSYSQFRTTVILIVDITDITDIVRDVFDYMGKPQDGIFSLNNQEAELTIFMSRGRRLLANIFIGEDRIDILEQRHWGRR